MFKNKEQIETETALVGKTIAKVDGSQFIFTDGSVLWIELGVSYDCPYMELEYTPNA